jgi:uncharacterized membrane protein YqhA
MATQVFARALQYMMVSAALGSAIGALLMFWLGATKLLNAVRSGVVAAPLEAATMTTSVMGATDAFLFGVVLVTFSYAIMYGFGLEGLGHSRTSGATWTWVKGIAELKHVLIEVILVYLAVDFATDLVELAGPLPWQTLVTPVAIVLIAGSLRLLGTVRLTEGTERPDRAGDPAS